MIRKVKRVLQDYLFRIINKGRIKKIDDLNKAQSDLIKIFDDYGYFNSVKKSIPLGKNDEPLPWYTYPAIEYLTQLDLKDKTVFEWGCGNSSIFFARRTKEVITIEDNKEWYEKINVSKPENLTLVYAMNDEYVNIISDYNRTFDLIVIDANQRPSCAKIATKFLSPGGIIILDNSDWFKNSAKILRDNNMIQIDFHGFGPFNNYTWTTSFFFSRDFNFKTSDDKQPSFTIGGLTHICD